MTPSSVEPPGGPQRARGTSRVGCRAVSAGFLGWSASSDVSWTSLLAPRFGTPRARRTPRRGRRGSRRAYGGPDGRPRRTPAPGGPAGGDAPSAPRAAQQPSAADPFARHRQQAAHIAVGPWRVFAGIYTVADLRLPYDASHSFLMSRNSSSDRQTDSHIPMVSGIALPCA